jgi:dienelactone hydrolase
MKKLMLLVCLQMSLCTLALGADRKALFATPDFKAVPPAVEVISETTAEGVTTTELYFAGAPFDGAPTRIYAFYARPAAPGKYPGVVQLHGAGLATLSPAPAQFYAKHGYACISIDWAGPGTNGMGSPNRTGRMSSFNSEGSVARPQLLPDGTPDKTKPWQVTPPEVNAITNGVRFALRAFMFLRSRPEVDANRLCLEGTSMGAHLSLLVLGQDPTIKAAAVKYGEGYIRDLPGYFGGAFGPLTLAPKDQQDAWLAVLDPKYDEPNYHAKVLLLSGTADMFFMMPIVLKTYEAIPTDKRLVMEPNDNHGQIFNQDLPLRWFNAVFGLAPAYPEAATPTATVEGDGLRLSTTLTGPSQFTKVEFWIDRGSINTWSHAGAIPPGGHDTRWVAAPATQGGDTWEATVPAVGDAEQLVAYVLAEDATGAVVASDTVEVPAFPKWRGLPEPTTLADGNFFLDPSFEAQRSGTVGQLYLNVQSGVKFDGTGAYAHTGKWAMGITGASDGYLAVGAPAEAGKKYRLSAWFRGQRDGDKAVLQINWAKAGGEFIKYDLSQPDLLTDYQQFTLEAVAPPGATGATLLLMSGSGPDETIWMDDVYFGEVK